MNSLPVPDDDDPLEELTSRAADEYMERLDRGESPDVEEFVAGRPEIADVLRRLLPALQAMRESEAGPRLAVAPGPTGAEPDRPGRLGDYEIIREIGRGGMGVVYEAVQLSLGRRVALKVLPFAAMLDPHRLQRFQNEARAAACLHHGNIVPIYGVGCDRGVHFYAMQYIEGRNLAALIQDLRRQAGLPPSSEGGPTGEWRAAKPGRNGETPAHATPTHGPVTPGPTNGTAPAHSAGAPASAVPTRADAAQPTQRSAPPAASFRTAARLALQAAEALHHAHQQGVVHRDVKPANVIVDAKGRLWVTDFGLAQVQSDPRLTTTGNVLGTLRYMSPEQASGDPVVDHRTDVFSLGATLYELLALRPAFGGRDRAAVLRRVVQDEPKPLRRINPAIPTDLETIVAKAMAKSPAERYLTAQAMADDLRRFLEDKPILARRPSLLEKAAKWSRRRRHLVAAVMAGLWIAVCALTVSTVLVSYQKTETQRALDQVSEKERQNKLALDQVTQEKARKEEALEAADQQRQRAEEAAAKAHQVLNIFTQISEDEIPDKPELRPLRRKLLETALAYYKDFIEQESDDPAVQAEMVNSKLRVAAIIGEIGDKEYALAILEQIRGELHASGVPGMLNLLAGPGISVSNLLMQPAVRQDLKFSDDQVKQIAALANRRRDPLGRDDAAKEQACFELLHPEQAKRLQQIIWQQRGAHVFADADVADQLGLSAEQRERIHHIEEEALRGSVVHFIDRHDGGKRPDDYWKDASDRIRGVLTDEQKTKWKEMIGDPFQGEIRFDRSVTFTSLVPFSKPMTPTHFHH